MKKAWIIGILMLIVGAVCIKARPLPAVSDKVQEAKKIALTFDDGPHQKYTKVLLDGLRERNVTATFFLIGESIEGKEELVKQMKEDAGVIINITLVYGLFKGYNGFINFIIYLLHEFIVLFAGEFRPMNCLWFSVTPLPLSEKRSGR